MNVIEAAKETIEKWKHYIESNNYSHNSKNEISFGHCASMVRTMEKGISKESGEPFSEGKLNRWLGWIQACCVCNTNVTLEEMKQINMKWSDKKDTIK